MISAQCLSYRSLALAAIVLSTAPLLCRAASWERFASLPALGRDSPINMSFVDQRRGWLMDSSGSLWRTSDGGRTWQNLGKPERAAVIRFGFVSHSDGWLQSHSHVLWTSDGGEHWRPLSLPRELLDGSIGDVCVQDKEHVWIVASTRAISPPQRSRSESPGDHGVEGAIYSTPDFGRTWMRGKVLATGFDTLSSIVFSSKNAGFALGHVGILFSHDGGTTWHRGKLNTACISKGFMTRDTQFDDGAISVVSPGEAFVAYKHGEILRTTDGGENWCEVPQTRNTRWDFDATQFTDTHSGWGRTWDHHLVHSTDGGVSWEPVHGVGDYVFDLRCTGGHAWLGTDQGIWELRR